MSDPYRYYRAEAGELLDRLSQGLLELEREEGRTDIAVRLLRAAHTLKGAARVVRHASVAEAAHRLEEGLSALRDQPGPPDPAALQAWLVLVDGMAAQVREVGRAPAAEQVAELPLERLRVGLAEVDEVRGAVSGVSRTLARLSQDLGRASESAERARTLVRALEQEGAAAPLRRLAEDLARGLDPLRRTLPARAERVQRQLEHLRESADRMRLLPASALFGPLERAVRDAALSSGKAVAWSARGGHEKLDAEVLQGVREALLHVVVNAVVHGIESGPERRAAGKPPQGEITLSALRDGDRLVFLIRDDGRGFDVPALQRALQERGRPLPAGDLTMQDLLPWLEGGGTSTRATTDHLSGRGVGLDVLLTAARAMRGSVRVDSTPGEGSRIRLEVPVSLATLRVLLVECASGRYLLPLDSVQRVLPRGSAPGGRVLVVEDQAVAYHSLDSLLGHATRAAGGSVVLLESDAGRAALGVDRVLGASEMLIQPLPEFAGRPRLVAGAALDPAGGPRLLLDPRALLQAPSPAPRPEPVRRAAADPVLVVDDSLTTRMLEKNILEAAGHPVELAASAEEALEKLRRGPIRMMLVDLEMPGMDGFELLEACRSDPALAGIPAVMVTSRNKPEDRVRAESLGVRDYIVKSEFDQERLLGAIRRLG